MSTAPALTPARVTRLAKPAAPELRWSSEKGVRGILVRLWDAPQDGTLRTELRLLNEARRLINATDLSATVVSVRSRRGVPQFRILVTSEAQESAAIQEQADKRAAALAAAAEEVKAAQDDRAAAPVEERVQAHIDAALAPQRTSAAEGFPAEEDAPKAGTEYVVFCPNHQHYLRFAGTTGTTWTDSQDEARRYTKTEARQQAQSATWRDHNPTAWALPSSGPAELELSEQARRTIAAMREERERLEGLSPAPEKGYPPVTVQECEEALAEGIVLIVDGPSGYTVQVQQRASGAILGRVRAVTEEMGTGFWVRFAAYRLDGSRVGYAKTRVGAASLLLPPMEEPFVDVRPEHGRPVYAVCAGDGTVLSEHPSRAQAEHALRVAPATVTLTNPELWG